MPDSEGVRVTSQQYYESAPAQAGPETIRVLSVPAGHVYVRHLSSATGDDGVLRLPDPQVSPGVPAAQWWPPPALEADWVREHADEFDVYHVHFGFDARSPRQLQDLVEALRSQGRPLVYTVHDLRNPHHLDRTLHDEALDVLVPAADAVLTLTTGAADEIRERWGRFAHVLPHPHVVEQPRLSAARPAREDYVVGLHLKSLRASMDPLPVLDVLTRVVPELPGARLRVDVHTDVVTPGYPRYDAEVTRRLRAAEDGGLLELQVHDFFTDEELWDYFQGLDLSVLPYRFGTHSGWLEACYDLGTPVLTADCGYYRDQRPCLTYRLDETGLDAASLEAGLRRAHAERPQWRADPRMRADEREMLAAEHRRIYQGLLEVRRA
jgi:glycosyltransferase involved in cell wall biosynthesis